MSSPSQKPNLTTYILYIEGQSTAIRRILQSYSIATHFTPVLTLMDLITHLKDPLTLEEQTGVNYSISCSHCNDYYIGETGRSLKTREEHQTNVAKGEVVKNAIAEHVWTHGHQIDWTSSKVLNYHLHQWSRKLLES